MYITEKPFEFGFLTNWGKILLEVLDRASIRSLNKVRLVTKDSNDIILASEALEIAEDQGLDLVLVSNEVEPPVVRIKDQKKEEYEKKKNRKPTKKIEVKEIRFMANISDHDLDTKLKSISKFLEKGKDEVREGSI